MNKPIVSNAFPIIKVVMPVDLAGVKWGFLSDALLERFQFNELMAIEMT